MVPSPYRSWMGVLVDDINGVDARRRDDTVTAVLPESVPSGWWQQVLQDQAIFRLKAALLYRLRIVVTGVPFLLR